MGIYAKEPQFAETQVVLALLNDDRDEAGRLLRNMTKTELGALETVAYWLSDMATQERQRRHRNAISGSGEER